MYIYGPHNSRRIGLSLGIDLLAFPPYKKCNLDCVYCEIGETPKMGKMSINDRIDLDEDFFEEIKQYLPRYIERGLDSITIGYLGEPTLSKGLERTIKTIRKLVNSTKQDSALGTIPRISVFTNSTTLLSDSSQNIIDVLIKADDVIAKLDCARQETFELINQPVHIEKVSSIKEMLSIKDIVKNLRILSERINEFNMNSTSAEIPKKRLIIQTLLLENDEESGIGVNSITNASKNELEALGKAYYYIKPSEVHLYTIFRPPAYPGYSPLSSARLKEIKEEVEQYLKEFEIAKNKDGEIKHDQKSRSIIIRSFGP